MSTASGGPDWAIVTGASAGIGRELARGLAAEGHALVLVARRAEALAALAEELRQAHGIQALPLAIDLAGVDGADRLTGELTARGIVPRVLVNNAGIGVYGMHAGNPVEEVQALLDLNIIALTRLTRKLLPAMLAAGRGHILNMASTAAFMPGPRMAVYFASKAYVLSYSEALAEELAGSGISVTALCPGPTRSGFFRRARMRDDTLSNDLADAAAVARFGLQAMRRGQRVGIHRVRNKLLVLAARVAPRRMLAAIVERVTRPP
ncbi:MAG: SDR family oxidoreductase [Pseudoxanthomonas suwonensis]|nr:SDR family oxidoreductase [Pseudoxanthomonas suwonensis]